MMLGVLILSAAAGAVIGLLIALLRRGVAVALLRPERRYGRPHPGPVVVVSAALLALIVLGLNTNADLVSPLIVVTATLVVWVWLERSAPSVGQFIPESGMTKAH